MPPRWHAIPRSPHRMGAILDQDHPGGVGFAHEGLLEEGAGEVGAAEHGATTGCGPTF